MKTTANKNNTTSNSHTSKPFFNKSKEGSFFYPSKKVETPFFTSSTIQPKLTMGQPGDKYEREADFVADNVVQSMDRPASSSLSQTKSKFLSPEEGIQKKEERENEEEVLQKSAFDTNEPPPNHLIQSKPDGTTSSSSNLESELNASKGLGKPLDEDVREQMEPAFGTDFQNVSVHTDTRAGQMNKSLGAKAFTHGADIYFNDGMYAPDNDSGKHLMAHELTHVVQQTNVQAQQNGNGASQISRTPQPSIQREIQDVQQAELVTFISQPEGMFPPLDDKYLIEPALMATQRAVIRTLVRRVQGGDPPLTTSQFLELVMSQESDRGTALIICHNVAKALARGQSPINWANISRHPNPLVYSLNGVEYTFDPADFHDDAEESGTLGQSVFYAMFSANELGGGDEGNLYHYYAIAVVSYYNISGNLQPDRSEGFTQVMGNLVRRVADALRDSSVTRSSAYDAWVMANAVSFLEGGSYGHGQEEVDTESNIHIQGASSGLEAEGKIPMDDWKWYVPVAQSIRIQDLHNFQFRPNDMVHTIREGVDGEFELSIISGNTPNHWYDTPDPFVQLPGFSLFGRSRTTTKVDTTTPVWNEILRTLHHRALSSVTLELKDEDPISNDSITTFTDDLRPLGQRSRIFTLTSSSSTLEVSVNAVGHVVLAN